MGKILRTVACDLVAADLPVIHNDKSRTGKIVFQPHCPALQSCRRRDDLKCRARLIRVIDTSVSPHPVQQILRALLAGLSLPLLRTSRLHSLHLKLVDQCIWIVQVELRHIHHRENLAIVDIHDDDRHACRLFCLIRLLCKLCRVPLYVDIDADIQILSRLRLLPPLSHTVKLDPLGVRQCQDLSLFAGQVLLIGNLQADDPLIIPSCKAQHLRCQIVIRIIALIVLIHLHSRHIIISYPVACLFVHIALDALPRTVLLHALAHILLGKIQLPAQHIDHFLRLLQLAVDDRYRTYCLVVRQDRSCRVNDPASCGLDIALPLVQLRGQLCIML